MDTELATLLFMGLILKIPVVGMLYLVWWACRDAPAPAEAAEGDDGHGFRRWRSQPSPRRDPHGPTAGGAAKRPSRRPVREGRRDLAAPTAVKRG